MNGPDFVIIAKGFVEGVISGLFSPLLHSRWESDFYNRFSNFFQALHYMQKKSGFDHPLFEGFVHLYLAFVTMHKTYFEFLCKNSFALSLLYSTLFWETAEIIFQLYSFAQKIHRILLMRSFMLSTTLFHTFSGNYKCFYKNFCDFRYFKPF